MCNWGPESHCWEAEQGSADSKGGEVECSTAFLVYLVVYKLLLKISRFQFSKMLQLFIEWYIKALIVILCDSKLEFDFKLFLFCHCKKEIFIYIYNSF